MFYDFDINWKDYDFVSGSRCIESSFLLILHKVSNSDVYKSSFLLIMYMFRLLF